MSGRKIISMRLHEPVFLPDVGDLTNNLPPTSKTLILEMVEEANGISVKAQFGNKKGEGIVPWANVKFAVRAPEITMDPKAKSGAV